MTTGADSAAAADDAGRRRRSPWHQGGEVRPDQDHVPLATQRVLGRQAS
jgi:hypothetical protein